MGKGKLVDIRTEHGHQIKVTFEVLKDILNEVKVDFIKDPNEHKKQQYTSDDDSDSDNSDSSSESPEEEPKKSKKQEISEELYSSDDEKKTVKGKKVQKKGKPQIKESSSENESDGDKKKKNKKVLAKKGKKIAEESSDEDESNDDDNKKNKKCKSVNYAGGGIKILALDEHQTLLIYVKLHAEQFVKFKVKPDVYSIGLDLLQLHRFMKSVDKDSIMNISIDKDDEQNIMFSLENDSKHSEADYKQKLLDIDENTKKLPEETNFEMHVVMDTSDFKKICAEMNNFSEFVEITCTSKEITFTCQGDSNHYVRKFNNSEKGVRIKCLKTGSKTPTIFQAIYNLKHLVTFGKCSNLCPEMQLFLKNDYPLFINYTIGAIGKMLAGLSPVDEKAIKRDNDYDENTDKYYNNKKIVMKDE